MTRSSPMSRGIAPALVTTRGIDRSVARSPGEDDFNCDQAASPSCAYIGRLDKVHSVPAGTDAPLPNVLVLREDGGTHASVSTDAEGRVLVRGLGEWDPEDGHVIVEGLAKAIADGRKLRCFWDLGGLDRYQTQVRRDATNWLVANFRALDPTIHVLVANTMVAMAVSTAGVALSLVGVRVVATREPDEFRARLAEPLAAEATAAT